MKRLALILIPAVLLQTNEAIACLSRTEAQEKWPHGHLYVDAVTRCWVANEEKRRTEIIYPSLIRGPPPNALWLHPSPSINWVVLIDIDVHYKFSPWNARIEGLLK